MRRPQRLAGEDRAPGRHGVGARQDFHGAVVHFAKAGESVDGPWPRSGIDAQALPGARGDECCTLAFGVEDASGKKNAHGVPSAAGGHEQRSAIGRFSLLVLSGGVGNGLPTLLRKKTPPLACGEGARGAAKDSRSYVRDSQPGSLAMPRLSTGSQR